MLPGAYDLWMRTLRTARSLTSRNISSAPPARTLMPIHYLGRRRVSQETGAKREWITHWFGQLKLMVPICAFSPEVLPAKHQATGNHVVQRLFSFREARHDVADAEGNHSCDNFGKEAARGAAKRDGLAQQVGDIDPHQLLAPRSLLFAALQIGVIRPLRKHGNCGKIRTTLGAIHGQRPPISSAKNS